VSKLTPTLRDRLERQLPAWLMGVLDWPGYRLFGRCWAQGCGRLVILHSPWALYLCERTPIAISITPEGEAHDQETVIEEDDFAA
jgi:hypothetical protein